MHYAPMHHTSYNMHGPSEGDDEISFSEFVDMIQNLTVRTVRDCVGALKNLILYPTRTQNFVKCCLDLCFSNVHISTDLSGMVWGRDASYICAC